MMYDGRCLECRSTRCSIGGSALTKWRGTLSNLEILIQQEINKTYESIENRAKKGFDYLIKNTGHLTQSKKQKLSTYFALKGYNCDVYEEKIKISWGRKNE